ncbi:MAG: hypothetical protein R3B91_11075 [Planctomycetaceae bacterium]
MKTLDLQAIQPKTTLSRHTLGYNSNLLVDREPPTRIYEVWGGDLTNHPV